MLWARSELSLKFERLISDSTGHRYKAVVALRLFIDYPSTLFGTVINPNYNSRRVGVYFYTFHGQRQLKLGHSTVSAQVKCRCSAHRTTREYCGLVYKCPKVRYRREGCILRTSFVYESYRNNTTPTRALLCSLFAFIPLLFICSSRSPPPSQPIPPNGYQQHLPPTLAQ